MTWQVEEAIRHLTPGHRAVLVETYFRGRTSKEVAGMLGIAEGTVRSRLYHASAIGALEPREVGMGAVSPRSCPAWRGRLAMWAVGGLEQDEADLVAEHLAACEPCREEADDLDGIARLLSTVDLASVDPISPSADAGADEGRGPGRRPSADVPGAAAPARGSRVEPGRPPGGRRGRNRGCRDRDGGIGARRLRRVGRRTTRALGAPRG